MRPQGLKPGLISKHLRGAESAALPRHGSVREFFRNLLSRALPRTIAYLLLGAASELLMVETGSC